MLAARSLSEEDGEVSGDGGTRSPLLSVGNYCSGNRAVALRKAPPGRLLVVDHYFRRATGGGSVRFRGDDTGPGVAARGGSRIRATVADSGARDTNSGQSFGGKPGRVGGIVF